jgi:hypothetical protein
MRPALTGHVLLLAVALAAPRAQAGPPDVASPLVARPIAPADPVLGADGRVHLAYELLLVNMVAAPVTIDSVAALNPVLDGTAVETLQGKALADVMRLDAGGTGATLGPGVAAILFMDATLPPDTAFPPTLEHRFSITYQRKPPAPTPGDHDPAPPQPEKITFVGVPVQVGQRAAVVLAPPLRGGRWLVGNGCCATANGHRGATLPINGSIDVAERFAIDFVRLDADGRLFTGDQAKLSSYAYFGADIHAVADGVVVSTEDGAPEQVPGKLPANATLQNAAGNHVVEDIGDGRFALYAHLQPGSLRVKPGDRVTRAQVIGLLGNSGNTDAPHLHFHVMNGPSPLRANGLPYAFTSFVGNGVVTSEAPLWKGAPAPIDASALAGDHTNQLPLNDQLITFPE